MRDGGKKIQKLSEVNFDMSVAMPVQGFGVCLGAFDMAGSDCGRLEGGLGGGGENSGELIER